MHAEVRRWRDSNGNTYHSVMLHYYNIVKYETRYSGVEYGYDTAWLKTASELHAKTFPFKHKLEPTFASLQAKGITYSVVDVPTKRQL